MGFRCLSDRPIFALFLLVLSPFADAHPSLGEYVQHRYRLDVSASDIDLTIELVFNGAHAAKERATLDSNGNGVITQQETSDYIKHLGELGETSVNLSYKGSTLELIELQTADVDLQDDRTVDTHPLALRLHFFARKPEHFHDGDVMTLRSGLWNDAPALVVFESEGQRGDKAAAAGTGALLPALTEGTRTFELAIGRRPDARLEGGVELQGQTKEQTKP